MLYGARMNESSWEITGEGGQLFRQFKSVIENINQSISEAQVDPSNINNENLWNFSWGFADHFILENQRFYYSGTR